MKSLAWFAWSGIATLLFCSVANAQLPNVSIRVGFHPERSAPFEIDSYPPIGAPWNDLVAPDGTMVGDHNVFGSTEPISNLTQSELKSRFAGTWTIRDYFGAPSGSPWEYKFNITSDQLVMLASVPEILSPAEGSQVPAVFDIQHSGTGYTMHGQSSNGSFRAGGTGGHVDQSNFSNDFPYAVQAWATNSSSFVVGNATPIGGASRELLIGVINTSYSEPRNWTLGVPEPASATLAATGLLSLTVLRRRK